MTDRSAAAPRPGASRHRHPAHALARNFLLSNSLHLRALTQPTFPRPYTLARAVHPGTSTFQYADLEPNLRLGGPVWVLIDSLHSMDNSATALCEQLEDVRAAVRRKVWGEEPGSPPVRDDRPVTTDTRRESVEMGRPRGCGTGRLALRTRSRAYARVSHHPSVSSLATAAAHDAGLGVKPRYGRAQSIPYPRELLNDPGTLTRARRKRAAARCAQSAGASASRSRETETKSIELAISCAMLEGVPSLQARQPKGTKLAVCVQARLLLWRRGCWELHGSTEPVRHGETPAFAKTFILRVPREMLESGGEPQQRRPTGPSSWEADGMQCRVELHYRWGARATDATQPAAAEALIGHLEFPIRQLMGTPGQCLGTRLEPAGRLVVRGILVHAGLHQQATVRLRASLSSTTKTPANGQAATSASYFFTVSRDVGASASALSPYELIARSENITNRRTKTLGCRDLSLSTHKLCYGNLDNKLQVSVFQYDPFGQHKLVGDATFCPSEALHFPAPLGSPSSHLRVQTMSALDVSCISNSNVDSSTIRLGSRPHLALSDQNSERLQDSSGNKHDEDADQGNNESDPEPPAPSSRLDVSDTEQSDPFSMLHCPLYGPAAGSSSGDRMIVGALRVSLGVSETTEIPASLLPSRARARKTHSATDEQSTATGCGRVPMLHESLDGNYMRVMTGEDTLVRKSDEALHGEEALSHLAERRSAISRLAELQRLQRSTTLHLQQSLDMRTILRQQVPPDVAQMVAESAEERDARLFAGLYSGVEKERRLQSEQEQAEEQGQIETFLSQPGRRRKQEAQAQQEMAERVRATRQSVESDFMPSFGLDQEDESSRWFQPTEAVEKALEQLLMEPKVTQRRSPSNSPTTEPPTTVATSWTRGSFMSTTRQSGTSQRSNRGQQEDMEAECDPDGFLRASLLFNEALNKQIVGAGHRQSVTQPSLLQVSGRESRQPMSAMQGGGATDIGSPSQRRTITRAGNGLGPPLVQALW